MRLCKPCMSLRLSLAYKVHNKLDILVKDLTKTDEHYNFDILEFIPFLRKHIHNFLNEYENYKIL